jgi:hypothetical protein
MPIGISMPHQSHTSSSNNNNNNNNNKIWYSHIPKSVTEHEDITVLWNQGVQTDREVLTNRPDILVKNKDRTCVLIVVAIPSNKNVIQKKAEKKLKYKNLCVEIQRMWNTK